MTQLILIETASIITWQGKWSTQWCTSLVFPPALCCVELCYQSVVAKLRGWNLSPLPLSVLRMFHRNIWKKSFKHFSGFSWSRLTWVDSLSWRVSTKRRPRGTLQGVPLNEDTSAASAKPLTLRVFECKWVSQCKDDKFTDPKKKKYF